jgi:hypothetical protein
MKGIRKFFEDGGGAGRVSLSFWSADVEAKWIIDDDGAGSLQVIYQRKGFGTVYDPKTGGPKEDPDQDYWLYLSPQDAAVLGAIFTGYAKAHGECT